MTVIGEAEVRIAPNTKGFGKQVEQDVESPLMSTAKKAGAAFAAALGAREVVSFFRDSVDAAADLGEEASKAGVVFGDSVDQVSEFADSSAEAFGQSESAALSAAGTYGNLFRSLGLAEEKSAEMSTTIAGLASDLASFNNVEVAEAVDALRAGMVGETEPLKRFGVNLNQATIEQEAMNQGLIEGKDDLDAAAKAQAAYSLILDQTKLAQGDFARTSDELANQQRILTAEWDDAKAEIGEGLLPVALELVGALRGDTIPAVTELATAAVPLLIEGLEVALPLFGSATDILVALSPALEAVASAIGAIPDPLLSAAAIGFTASKALGGVGTAAGMVANKAASMVAINWSGHLTGGATAATSMTGSLRSLTTGMSGATAAAGLAVTAWTLWSSAMDEARNAAEETGEWIRSELNENLKESSDPLAELEDRLGRVRNAQEDFEGKLAGSNAPWDADYREGLRASIDELEKTDSQLVAMRDTAQALGDRYGVTADEALELALAQGIDLTEGVGESEEAFAGALTEQRNMEDSLGDVADASADTTEAMQDQLDALNDLQDATLAAADANLGYRDSEDDTRDAIEEMRAAEEALEASRGPEGAREVEKAELELAEAKRELTRVQNDQEASQLDIINAQDRVRESQRKVDEASRRGGEAYEDLTQSIRDAERSALDQAEAAVRVAEEEANAAGETLSWEEKNRILKSELNRVRETIEPGSPLHTALGETIENLENIPGTYEASVKVGVQWDAGGGVSGDILQTLGAAGLIEAAHGFAGRVSRPTMFMAGEGGEDEDVLVVPASAGGIDRVVANMAAQQAADQAVGRLGGSAGGGASTITRGGHVVESGAIQIVAPDTPAGVIARETLDLLAYELDTRDS